MRYAPRRSQWILFPTKRVRFDMSTWYHCAVPIFWVVKSTNHSNIHIIYYIIYRKSLRCNNWLAHFLCAICSASFSCSEYWIWKLKYPTRFSAMFSCLETVTFLLNWDNNGMMILEQILWFMTISREIYAFYSNEIGEINIWSVNFDSVDEH